MTRGIKLTIEFFQNWAINKNGECLSETYINAHSKLHFKCNICSHDWWATPQNIKHGGTWCPKCVKSNERNPAWKGKEACKETIHSWIRRHKPRPESGLCVICNKKPFYEIAFKYHKIKNYTRNIEDYWWTCKSCHSKKDKKMGKENPNFKYEIKGDDLYDLYIIQNIKAQEIADSYGCSISTIKRNFKKNNIKKNCGYK